MLAYRKGAIVLYYSIILNGDEVGLVLKWMVITIWH